ncbi:MULTISPECIES: signal peptidase II [unclassified Streptomyces]|uniref:signal peptidase II n=1 Tax=unclassified Streptomyces TaxID=2593676 RepID=UPI002E2DBFA4|nr:signal peptidase II [Streptomyces sp. NBC_01423]WSX90510.1 signal peptidase II [Streptomyces sp. NBC_00891]WSY04991.1 signal peptidase II [Streptomyces sp. NBC_00890]WSZ06615.1 signal peptidase II [Streptomyces sp. NBC_00869]WSZ25886.1 signal peptidase II [Streptomyces sp. NBC_00870]
MAEAERIIGTPDITGAEGSGETGPDGAAASPDSAVPPTPDTGATAADAEVDRSPATRRRRIILLFCVAVVAYLLDLGSKMLVVAKLEHQEPIELLGDWLKLDAIRNAGAAFGFGEAFTIIFTIIAATVIVVIARIARKLYSLPWAIALGLLLGGALGNLTDRIFRAPGVFEGAVVDFIAPAHFAVFNLADSAIVCGGILIVLLSFKGLDPDGAVHKD